ncbi:uncharacterized protein LOC117585585 [Drosophila guanche]|uniref:Uncharacterized protein n=1 Tax=Drosophila guanche TaxID=7266 RepID=A0A3B0K5N6_DROGU|nr:uncharacterized protein LOC117585585 [Drosophila guanche]SPP83360.1 Hypothetical predicted protein [Drosophila guanche]
MSADKCKLMPSVYEELTHHSMKRQLERNGTLAALSSGVHVEILKLVKGNLGGSTAEPLAGPEVAPGHNSIKDRGLSPLINQLMMEYLEWFGYRHTLETLKLETGQKVACREEIEQTLALDFPLRDVPLLVQLILRQQGSAPDPKDCLRKTLKVAPKKVVKLPLPEKSMKFPLPEKSMKLAEPQKSTRNQKSIEKSARMLQVPENSIPERCTRLKERLETLRTLKETAKTDWTTPVPKLVQNNRKLIDKKIESHAKRATIVKSQMKENPKAFFHSLTKESPESRPPVNSSESDELPSYDEHSDASSDIPDRHYYVEQEPPEVEYAPGHGEEGPYNAKQVKAETLLQRYQQEKRKASSQQKSMTAKQPPLSKQSLTFTNKLAVKRKSFEVPEVFVTSPPENNYPMNVRDGLNLNLNKLMSSKNRLSSAQITPKKSPLWNKIEVDEDEPNLPVSKPPCPETHIRGIQLDSSSESSESGYEKNVADGYHSEDESSDDENQ